MDGPLPVTTLSRPDEIGLVNALLARSGERIDGDEKLWSAFKRHVQRRHNFLHRGEIPTAEEAKESAETCLGFTERLLTLAEEASRKLDAVATRTSACASRQTEQCRISMSSPGLTYAPHRPRWAWADRPASACAVVWARRPGPGRTAPPKSDVMATSEGSRPPTSPDPCVT